jgi:hypothetical protein
MTQELSKQALRRLRLFFEALPCSSADLTHTCPDPVSLGQQQPLPGVQLGFVDDIAVHHLRHGHEGTSLTR